MRDTVNTMMELWARDIVANPLVVRDSLKLSVATDVLVAMSKMAEVATLVALPAPAAPTEQAAAPSVTVTETAAPPSPAGAYRSQKSDVKVWHKVQALPQEERTHLLDLYARGYTMEQIGQKHMISAEAVSLVLRLAGVDTKNGMGLKGRNRARKLRAKQTQSAGREAQ